ncbi:hypothetical protein LCGC14_0164240 [marine sediment metagenome]|uniref:Uncharacterized protein n=1 Tax=marine sediment metagenome TaxID=412755 RepID=A0A0F9UUT1_9ZZZZ
MDQTRHVIRQMLTEAAPDHCALGTIYGGLPEGGWFQAYTEYEIGLQRIAEAVHCILGSLGSAVYAKASPLRIEVGHINEEMGIIRHVNEEYVRDVYREHLEVSKYKDESLESMQKAATRLRKRATRMKGSLQVEDPLYRAAADACYDVVIKLAEATLGILVVYERTGTLYYPLNNSKYREAVEHLDDSLRALVEQYGEDRPYNPSYY